MKLCWRGSTGHVRSIWYRANWLASLFCGLPCVPALLSHGMFRRPGATSATWHQSCFRNCPTDHCGGQHIFIQMGDLYHICYSHCLTFTLLLRFFLLFIIKMCVCECMFVTKVSTKSAERLCLCELDHRCPLLWAVLFFPQNNCTVVYLCTWKCVYIENEICFERYSEHVFFLNKCIEEVKMLYRSIVLYFFHYSFSHSCCIFIKQNQILSLITLAF